MKKVNQLQQALLSWFAANARPLPWREQYRSYQVWVSEIMLQQTQAERGVVYFKRWMAHFPDVVSLAAATEDEILKCWEGLGYYSRARNLHAAAKRVVQVHGGKLPDTLAALEALPGIGKYTARAILSIAFQQDSPVVDGNVERLFARLFAIDEPVKKAAGQSRIWGLAEALLPLGQAREWNQALMECGALVCVRGTPRCELCPVTAECESFSTGTTGARPVVEGGKKIVQVRLVAAVVVDDSGRVYVRQRPANVRWANMWEFPDLEITESAQPLKAVVGLFKKGASRSLDGFLPLTTVNHKYTRYQATVHPFLCRLRGAFSGKLQQEEQPCRWVTLEELNSLAFSSGHRQIIDYLPEFLPEQKI